MPIVPTESISENASKNIFQVRDALLDTFTLFKDSNISTFESAQGAINFFGIVITAHLKSLEKTGVGIGDATTKEEMLDVLLKDFKNYIRANFKKIDSEGF